MAGLNTTTFTKQQMKQQYKKCAMDPLYFLKTYTYVQHPTRGKVQFKLYPFQQTTILEFIKHSWNIIVKSRQLGISTVCAGYALWLMTFNKDKSVLVIANKQDVAKNLIRKVRLMYTHLPPFLQQPLLIDNKQSLFFANDSFIKAESANPNAGVSQALSLLIIDQAAVLQESLFQQIFTAASPTLSTGGDFIVLSTPRGVGGLFHQLWVQAVQGTNRFNPIKLPWQVHPQRDQAFRDSQTLQMGQKKAKQEFDCDFSSSGDNVIPKEVLERIQATDIMDPIQKMHHDELWLFKLPEGGKSYILSADVARGDGADFSAFHVISIDDYEQVAQFKGKISTTQYGQLIIRIGKMFNDAFVVVENATIGWAVIQHLITHRYKNLYYHKKDYKYIDIQLESKQQSSKQRDRQKDIPGFITSGHTRPIIINKTALSLQHTEMLIHSKRLLNQLWTFVWQHGKPQAMRGYNDDLVMSICIGVWVLNTSYIVKKYSIRFNKERLSLIDSGLNRQRAANQKQPASGFFNARTIQTQQTKVFVGNNEQIDLVDFYFGKSNQGRS